MEHVVSVRPYPSGRSLIVMGEQMADRLGIAAKKRCYVSFATQKNFVDVKLSRKPYKGEIFLSTDVYSNLHIPEYPTYEVRVKGNEVAFGPCIGILASQNEEGITKRRLKEISMNTLDYQRIHGAIIVFSLDKVDASNHLIEGYCYNPGTDSWEKGIFPYPLSIYRRSGLNEKWENHFLSVIGDTVFNNYSLGKWDMYKWLSQEPDIMPHLPYTKIYESKQDIHDMLQKYGVVYVKPIWGMKGFGVIKVYLENNAVMFQYRKDDKNVDITADNTEEMHKIMDKLFKPGEHIVQQGLDLIKYNGGVVDFRCVMQKNDAREWVCNAIVARIGARGSIVSNISSGGEALPEVEVIGKILSSSERETFILKERIISLCIKVCRALDVYGINYGTLGLDIGMDKDKNIWLIEVNNRRPHPAIAMRVNDIQSYYTILASPLYYAKSLAGFGREEDANHAL